MRFSSAAGCSQPAWKILAGCGVMQLLHTVAGVNRLKKPVAEYIRWGTLAVVALYVLAILPMSIYMIRSTIEVAMLRQAGGEWSYTSNFSFVKVWDWIAMVLLTGGSYSPKGFGRYLLQAVLTAWPFVAGALLWLVGKEKSSGSN